MPNGSMIEIFKRSFILMDFMGLKDKNPKYFTIPTNNIFQYGFSPNF
jgi:hypothetical protein